MASLATWRIRATVTFAGVDNVISQKDINRVLSEAVAEVVLVVAHGRVADVARYASNSALPCAGEVRL